MTEILPAEGWYRDPYEIHHDRWFSEGEPTKLVRDGERETYDPPPSQPLPEGDLVPAEDGGQEARNGADLRRADEASTDPYDSARARRAAFDVFDLTAGTN